MVMRVVVIFAFSAWFVCLGEPRVNAQASSSNNKRPNILLIVADDMGYSDIGCFGSEIPTPNIDALAKEGLICTQFYVSPTCSPTRSMLLSGVDNHQAGLGSMGELIYPNQKGRPGYEGYLSFRVVSLASLLKAAGYNTFMTGKWHLGRTQKQRPVARGFEKSFALLFGGASHFEDGVGLQESEKQAQYREDGQLVKKLPKQFYSTTFYTDKLISYIDNNRDKKKPFFGYLAYTTVHT